MTVKGYLTMMVLVEALWRIGIYRIGKYRCPMDINKLSWQVSYLTYCYHGNRTNSKTMASLLLLVVYILCAAADET